MRRLGVKEAMFKTTWSGDEVLPLPDIAEETKDVPKR